MPEIAPCAHAAAQVVPGGTIMRIYLAEAIGTFVLVFGGCGAAVLAGSHIGYVGVSLAFGLSLLAMAYTIGPISGCHINPAVTFGLMLARKIAPHAAAGYVVAQIVGAVLGAGVLLAVAHGTGSFDPVATGFASNGYGARSPGGYDVTSALVAEVVLTAFLVLTVLGATELRAPVGFAGIAIGLVLTLIHLVGIPVTNTSVNPARSIGPALFAGSVALNQLWLFVVAPLVGAAVAAGLFAVIRPPAPRLSAQAAESATPLEQLERVAR
jgi:aquaporin Z